MTTAPFVGMLPADPARVGGLHSSRRHAFGMAPPEPAAPPPSRNPRPPLPPKRALAGGAMTQVVLSQAEISDIRSDLEAVADVLAVEMEAVKEEAEAVTAEAVASTPEGYRAIPIIGPLLDPTQIRAALLLDAEALEGAAAKLLSPPAGPYLSEGVRSVLEEVIADARAVEAHFRQAGVGLLAGEAARLAREHAEGHVRAARSMTAAAERRIVAAEAAGVPVQEQEFEAGSFWTALAMAAGVIVIGLVVSEIF